MNSKKTIDTKNTPDVRFKGFDDNWSKELIGNLFEYLQPSPYITKLKNLLEFGRNPVLTANKSFLLGYTNETNTYNKKCILFDDFNQDYKYVNFSFLVRSSALKILLPANKNHTVEFLYYLLGSVFFEGYGHLRHYITYVKPKKVMLCNNNEASKISSFFLLIDNIINKSQKNLKYIKEFSNELLNKMIVQERVRILIYH